MISIPIKKAKELGYNPQREIVKACATILLEYDTYDTEFNKARNKVKTK